MTPMFDRSQPAPRNRRARAPRSGPAAGSPRPVVQQFEDTDMGWKRYYGYRQTKFSSDLHKHMEAWCDAAGRRPPRWNTWTDGVHPELREAAERAAAADSVSLHDHAAHLRSSQTFAFNLFLPFRARPAALSRCVGGLLGVDLSVERIQFEWVPPGPLLGELDGERPVADEPATAVDVALWSTLADGGRAAVLVEVKLAEAGFTECRGRGHPDNDRKDVCKTPGKFFAEPEACFVRRSPGRHRERRYWEIFAARHGGLRAAFPGADPEGPCPFARRAYQPMRNLAAAEALVQDPFSAVDRAWFALCCHEGNPEVVGQWEAWRALLPDPAMAPLLSASELVRAGEAEGHGEWAAWMRGRYLLAETPGAGAGTPGAG